MPVTGLDWKDPEIFIENIARPIRAGTSVTALSKDLGISRERVYQVLRLYGFSSRKELIEDVVNYQ